MSTTSGALGFVQGLQGGMAHSDQRRRNKAIDNLLDRDAHEKDLDFAARRKEFEKTGGDMSQFPDFDNPAEKDPMLVRGFNFLKDKFGFGSKPEDTEATAGLTEPVQSTQDEEAVQPDFSGNFMADGGRVRDDGVPALFDEEGNRRELTPEQIQHRTYGEYYVTEDEASENRAARSRGEHRNRNPYHQRYGAGVDRQGIANDRTGGGLGEAAKDVGRAIGESNTAQAIRNVGDVSEASVRNIKDAGNARATGRAVRGSMQDAGAGALNIVGGAAQDVSEGLGIGKGLDFVLGFVGFDGRRDNRQPDPATPPAGAEPKDAPAAQAIEATVGEGEGDASVAAKAVDSAIEMTPGHPDNPNQAFDWSEVSASGVTPEDIPSAPTEDWARYRQLSAEAAALRGDSVEEAQMEITKMQMDGFSSNAQQAAFLLRQGDPRGAALAMRMAYQYFPNGSDVRFGIAEGTTGPVLVGMGVDEKTGESVGDGTPMLLTPDVINAYVGQVADPKHWNAWTKDWHELAQKDREYNEITKPKEEQAMRTDAARERALDAGAYKDRVDAANDLRGGGSKPLTQADKDRAFGAFMESQELRALKDERLSQELASNMSNLYANLSGQLPYPSIIDIVMGVHEGEFTLREGLERYGIDVGQ